MDNLAPEPAQHMPRKWLQGSYIGLAILALVYTWVLNSTYFDEASDFTGKGLGEFLVETQATAASSSLSVDLMFFFLAASVFMVTESQCVGVRFVWVYIAAGVVVGISVTFPLFLLARESKRGSTTRLPLSNLHLCLLALLIFTSVAVATFVTWFR